jgi:hypothetical protein
MTQELLKFQNVITDDFWHTQTLTRDKKTKSPIEQISCHKTVDKKISFAIYLGLHSPEYNRDWFEVKVCKFTKKFNPFTNFPTGEMDVEYLEPHTGFFPHGRLQKAKDYFLEMREKYMPGEEIFLRTKYVEGEGCGHILLAA